MESKIKTLKLAGLSSSEKTRSTIVDVEFGSPMKNCLHYGICRVTIPEASAQGHCPCRSRATISRWEDSMVQFVFDKKNISDSTYQKYFKNGYFQINDAYRLTEDIAVKIDRKDYIIMPGIYPVLEEENSLKLIF